MYKILQYTLVCEMIRFTLDAVIAYDHELELGLLFPRISIILLAHTNPFRYNLWVLEAQVLDTLHRYN